MTRRVPELHRAVPEAVVFMHPDDAEARGLQRGRRSRCMSRRGEIARAGRDPRAQQAAARAWSSCRCSTRAELINKLTLDATCPISKETDFKKCAVQGDAGLSISRRSPAATGHRGTLRNDLSDAHDR